MDLQPMTLFRNAVPSLSEVRAIAESYRTPLGRQTERRLRRLESEEPDPAVLEVVSGPFETVPDVADRLQELEAHFRERNDRRSVFLTVYAGMTASVEAKIESGSFLDSEWIREYLVTFAEYYRRALLAFERREFEDVPPPWRISFAAAVHGDALVLQDALLGINAHINYDLSYALHDVGVDPDRPAKRADHDRINDVLERLVDVVQETLVSVYSAAGVTAADELLGRIDERLALVGLQGGREFAWDNAVLLADVPWRPVRGFVDWRVRAVSTGAASLLVGPPLDSVDRERLRSVEDSLESVAAFHDEFTERAP
ncbi:MAG: DUF5995 family protein [Haloferacaceae archaeon]